MRFLSVCSGIEAASVAWTPLGWSAVAFSEIDRFAGAVLAYHYPTVPNWGDMTKFQDWPDATVDVLCGGTPCQSFSVAGLRKGLDDPRGNLMLTFAAIARRYRPQWLAWENVPGVLSSNGGWDFGAFLWLLGELGYGFAYRVLDAQYAGLAQRRKRVFVVGCAGDWRRAAAVLFERHSLSGHPAPSRQATKDPAGTLAGGARGRGGYSTDDVPLITETLRSHPRPGSNSVGALAYGGNNTTGAIDVAAGLNAKGGSGRLDFESETLIAHALTGESFDASEDGTGRGTPLVPIAFNSRQDPQTTGERSGALDGMSPQAQAVASMAGVRRLTPRECERLMGFSDDYTLIRYRGKPAKDGPRYRALGNSWAVPVVRWIGQRIVLVNAIPAARRAA